MAVKWTDEQKKVIEYRNRNILVSAAAGSGKTAVLVERIVKKITDKENAEKLFSTAELLKKDFWPAYFYHGLVLKDIGKKEKSNFCFEKCTALLDYFGADNPYNFILDSFSPSYIYSLCRTMIQS